MDAEEDVYLIKGEELSKRLKDKYEQGFTDGYNAALGIVPVEKGSAADLKEQEVTEEVSE